MALLVFEVFLSKGHTEAFRHPEALPHMSRLLTPHNLESRNACRLVPLFHGIGTVSPTGRTDQFPPRTKHRSQRIQRRVGLCSTRGDPHGMSYTTLRPTQRKYAYADATTTWLTIWIVYDSLHPEQCIVLRILHALIHILIHASGMELQGRLANILPTSQKTQKRSRHIPTKERRVMSPDTCNCTKQLIHLILSMSKPLLS